MLIIKKMILEKEKCPFSDFMSMRASDQDIMKYDITNNIKRLYCTEKTKFNR